MLYSCTRTATVVVKGLNDAWSHARECGRAMRRQMARALTLFVKHHHHHHVAMVTGCSGCWFRSMTLLIVSSIDAASTLSRRAGGRHQKCRPCRRSVADLSTRVPSRPPSVRQSVSHSAVDSVASPMNFSLPDGRAGGH